MENQYDKVMKNIEVTPEMHNRILDYIDNLDLDKVPRKIVPLVNYKKYLSIAACFLILIVGTVVFHNISNLPMNPPVENIPEEGIVEYNTARELSEAMGFTVKEMQEVPFNIESMQYISYWGELAEVKYIGQSETASLRVERGELDVSGNYEVYSNIKTHAIEGYSVTMKGNGDKYYLAVWQYDGFSYAVQFPGAVSEQELLTVIESLW